MAKIIDLYNSWQKIPDKIRFLIIGTLNMGISYIVFVIALHILGVKHYQIANALQWFLCSFLAYTNQKIFVFLTKGNWFKEYLKCCMSWAISYLINVIILEIFIRILHLNAYLAQGLSILSVAIITYVLLKYFAFKTPKK